MEKETCDYTPQFLELRKIINEVDPMELICSGCPVDEYDPEVQDILELISTLKSSYKLAEMIQNIFIRWFNEDIVGPYANYLEIAELIQKGLLFHTVKCGKKVDAEMETKILQVIEGINQ